MDCIVFLYVFLYGLLQRTFQAGQQLFSNIMNHARIYEWMNHTLFVRIKTCSKNTKYLNNWPHPLQHDPYITGSFGLVNYYSFNEIFHVKYLFINN